MYYPQLCKTKAVRATLIESLLQLHVIIHQQQFHLSRIWTVSLVQRASIQDSQQWRNWFLSGWYAVRMDPLCPHTCTNRHAHIHPHTQQNTKTITTLWDMTHWLIVYVCVIFTLSPSSLSSSCAELEGDGVADLLPGGEGELWVTEFPFSPSWDWFMVDNWLGGFMPDWLLGPSAASIGCWLLVKRESEFTICCICVDRKW